MPIPLLKSQRQRICLGSHHVNGSLICAPWPCSLGKPMPKPLRSARSFSPIPVGLIVFLHHIFAGTEGFGQSLGYGDGYLSIPFTSTPCNATAKFVTWRVAINFKRGYLTVKKWKIFSRPTCRLFCEINITLFLNWRRLTRQIFESECN